MHRPRGFTLVELLIALSLLGIIAAIALPSYQGYVTRTRRVDAKITLNELAQALERCYTQFGAYNDANCTVPASRNSGEGFYSVVVARTATTYTLTATAQVAQSADAKCASLVLNHLGQRSATGIAPGECW